MTFRNVLVATDLSQEAEAVIPVAIDIGQHTGARETLFYATEIIDLPEWSPPSEYQRLVQTALEQDRKILDGLRQRIADAGVEITAEIKDAVPARGIIEAAQRHQADLVLVGTHGRTGLRRFLLGSVAEHVVRNSPCSVWLARPAQRPLRSRILVPTDFSESAENALRTAVSLVEPGGEVVLLHCWSMPSPAASWPATPESPGDLLNAYREIFSDSGARLARQLVDRYQSPAFTLTYEHVEISPRAGILARLDQGDIDLVVMGSHGRRGAARWLLGSVAEATARGAPCSVLVIRS